MMSDSSQLCDCGSEVEHTKGYCEAIRKALACYHKQDIGNGRCLRCGAEILKLEWWLTRDELGKVVNFIDGLRGRAVPNL